MTLEDILDDLSAFGNPRVGRFGSGWVCNVDMNTNFIGSKFEISSTFGHASAMSAARQCHQRVHDAARSFKPTESKEIVA